MCYQSDVFFVNQIQFLCGSEYFSDTSYNE